MQVKYPLFLSDFNETWNFLDRFPKNTQVSNFIKIRPVGSELFHACGRTDKHDEANSHFSNFAKASKSVKGKGNVHPITGHEGPEGELLYSFLNLGSSLGVGGQRHTQAVFTPGKDPVSIVQEAGWAPVLVWIGAENLAPHRDSIP